jgi:phospholipid/cholesterol/gamma-HCH transport system substrate-binding protein
MKVARLVVGLVLATMLLAGVATAVTVSDAAQRIHVTAYFSNTNGLFAGDEVRILGVPVGGVDSIAPEARRSKVSFWFDRKYRVPADAKAVILAPALVSARIIQLTPAYTGGPAMANNAVIPETSTAVPVEWDDLRVQLQKLTDSLQPSRPGGVSPAGAAIITGADNLRGQGARVRDALLQLSQALSAIGDHSDDIFNTVKNLSTLVSALRSSNDVFAELNRNFAAVTNLLADDPTEVARSVTNLNTALVDLKGFLADSNDATGTTFAKLSSLTTSITESLPDLKQVLHVAPTSLSNFANTYKPANAALSGDFVFPNFATPLQFICSAVQSAHRINYAQSAKLCVQYLAPIFKNRQYNFPPLGLNFGLAQAPIPLPLPLPLPPFLAFLVAPIPIPLAGAMARPNEITYSEDWLRPDYNYKPALPPTPPPPPDLATAVSAPGGPAHASPPPPPAALTATGSGLPVPTDPSAGLHGVMIPQGAN